MLRDWPFNRGSLFTLSIDWLVYPQRLQSCWPSTFHRRGLAKLCSCPCVCLSVSSFFISFFLCSGVYLFIHTFICACVCVCWSGADRSEAVAALLCGGAASRQCFPGVRRLEHRSSSGRLGDAVEFFVGGRACMGTTSTPRFASAADDASEADWRSSREWVGTGRPEKANRLGLSSLRRADCLGAHRGVQRGSKASASPSFEFAELPQCQPCSNQQTLPWNEGLRDQAQERN